MSLTCGTLRARKVRYPLIVGLGWSAYALTPLPASAFSLAQAARRQYFVAHEREQLDRAVTLYRRYVDQVPSGGRRADALDALSQLEPLAALAASASANNANANANAGPSVTPAKDSAAVSRTRLLLTADAPAALIAIDGGARAASPVIREVEPGKHRVTVTAAGFFPVDREITAVAGELIPEAVALRERPSSVAVAAPPDAELYVDGGFRGRGDAELTIVLPSGSHRFTVGEKGHRVSSQVLELERGQTQSLQVTLQPTRQRRASLVLLVGGGAAFGTGIVFSVLSFQAQGRARDFLTKQSHGNVTSDDLIRYQGDVSARDRYRALAALSVVSAIGLSLTGLFLHELDHPDQQELSRPAGPAEREGGASAARQALRSAPGPTPAIAPILIADGFGASFCAAF